MSIVRWGEQGSHVYVIADVSGQWRCVGCDAPDSCVPYDKITEFIDHLKKWHLAKGDRIPDYVLEPSTYEEELKELENDQTHRRC